MSKQKREIKFSLPDELAICRFLQFKERSFYLKVPISDFMFYFQHGTALSSRILCDDSVFEIQKRVLNQSNSFDQFLRIFKNSLLLNHQKYTLRNEMEIAKDQLVDAFDIKNIEESSSLSNKNFHSTRKSIKMQSIDNSESCNSLQNKQMAKDFVYTCFKAIESNSLVKDQSLNRTMDQNANVHINLKDNNNLSTDSFTNNCNTATISGISDDNKGIKNSEDSNDISSEISNQETSFYKNKIPTDSPNAEFVNLGNNSNIISKECSDITINDIHSGNVFSGHCNKEYRYNQKSKQALKDCEIWVEGFPIASFVESVVLERINSQIFEKKDAKSYEIADLIKNLQKFGEECDWKNEYFSNRLKRSVTEVNKSSAKHIEISSKRTKKSEKNYLSTKTHSSSSNLFKKAGRSEEACKDVFTDEELQTILNLEIFDFSEMPENPKKIAEASFSEVFTINGLIYKIIPFNEWYGIEAFSKEVFILKCLKNEKGVCKLESSFLLKGSFTKAYLEAWSNFPNPENLNPSEYEKDQLYGVLVMQDCGVDLEKYNFKNYSEIVGFLHDLLSTLCNLESKYKFEHRDMHWGNIMIKDLEIFLIDFNFSRLETNKVVFTDLNTQDWLFEGDVKEDIQFSVYPAMRDACKSNWKFFNIKSNFLWIRYLLKKLLLKTHLFTENDCKATALKGLHKIIVKADEYGNCTEFFEWFCKFLSKKAIRSIKE